MSESQRAEYKSAELDLRETLLNWLERHPELTYAQAVQCLAENMVRWASHAADESLPRKRSKGKA